MSQLVDDYRLEHFVQSVINFSEDMREKRLLHFRSQ